MWVYFILLIHSLPQCAQITLIASDPHAALPIPSFPFTKRLSSQIYKFPQSSLAELARNSVIQSGFEMEVKRHWLGQYWYLPGDAGNEINKVRECCGLRFEFACVLIADPALQHGIRICSCRRTCRTAGSYLDTGRCKRSWPWSVGVRGEDRRVALDNSTTASLLDVYKRSLSVRCG